MDLCSMPQQQSTYRTQKNNDVKIKVYVILMKNIKLWTIKFVILNFMWYTQLSDENTKAQREF